MINKTDILEKKSFLNKSSVMLYRPDILYMTPFNWSHHVIPEVSDVAHGPFISDYVRIHHILTFLIYLETVLIYK